MSTIDGSDITGVTIDGESVKEITVDGETVWVAEQMVDDFESYASDSDLMNTYTEGTGDSSNFHVSSWGLLGTDQSLRVTDGSTQMIAAMRGDGSNLDHYIDNGDTFRFAWKCDNWYSGRRLGVWYGIEAYDAYSHGGYIVWVESDSDSIRIREWNDWNGNNVTGSVDISGYSSGETWECEVTWSGSDHDLLVYDNTDSFVGSSSGTDSTYSANDGTVGYSIDDSDNVGTRIDEVRLV